MLAQGLVSHLPTLGQGDPRTLAAGWPLGSWTGTSEQQDQAETFCGWLSRPAQEGHRAADISRIKAREDKPGPQTF